MPEEYYASGETTKRQPLDLDTQVEPQDEPQVEPQGEQPAKSTSKTIGYIAVIIMCVIYLLNPSSGVLEAIPDVLPVIGNLDEATATTALIWSIHKLREKP
jgi:hypothetical protein